MKSIFILIFLLITIKSQKTYINDPYINITIPEKSNDFILLKILRKI